MDRLTRLDRQKRDGYARLRHYERYFLMAMNNRRFVLDIPHAMLCACGNLDVQPGKGQGVKSIRRKIANASARAANTLCHMRGCFERIESDEDELRIRRSFSKEVMAQNEVMGDYADLLKWLKDYTLPACIWTEESTRLAWIAVEGVSQQSRRVQAEESEFYFLGEFTRGLVQRSMKFLAASQVLFGTTHAYDDQLRRICEECSVEPEFRQWAHECCGNVIAQYGRKESVIEP